MAGTPQEGAQEGEQGAQTEGTAGAKALGFTASVTGAEDGGWGSGSEVTRSLRPGQGEASGAREGGEADSRARRWEGAGGEVVRMAPRCAGGWAAQGSRGSGGGTPGVYSAGLVGESGPDPSVGGEMVSTERVATDERKRRRAVGAAEGLQGAWRPGGQVTKGSPAAKEGARVGGSTERGAQR